MSAIDWTTAENAIHAWVVTATGLNADHVIWTHQAGPRPSTPYISMTVTAITKVGRDWTTVLENTGGGPGEEILLRSRGHRYATISFQAFGPGSISILTDLVGSAPLFTVSLNTAGLGYAGFGTLNFIGDARLGDFLEPRAVVDTQFHLKSQLDIPETIIETVEITRESPDPDNTFTVPPE